MVPNMVIYYAGMHTPCVACTLAKESHIKSYMSVSGAVTAVTHAPVTVTLRVTRYVTVTLHGDPDSGELRRSHTHTHTRAHARTHAHTHA